MHATTSESYSIPHQEQNPPFPPKNIYNVPNHTEKLNPYLSTFRTTSNYLVKMEAAASSYAQFSQSSSNPILNVPPPPSIFKGYASIACQSVNTNSRNGGGFKSLLSQQQQRFLHCMKIKIGEDDRKRLLVGVVHASQVQKGSAAAAISDTDKWVLEPVGDGDWKHIGYRVQMPGSYEVVSSSVIVGRVPEKADLVIPVATVSGVHARIEKKEGSLYITDLDSTNGTFVGEKRVNPGVTLSVPPGSLLTFGDTHLAIFRVSKLENVQVEEEPGPSVENVEADEISETTN